MFKIDKTGLMTAAAWEETKDQRAKVVVTPTMQLNTEEIDAMKKEVLVYAEQDKKEVSLIKSREKTVG